MFQCLSQKHGILFDAIVPQGFIGFTQTNGHANAQRAGGYRRHVNGFLINGFGLIGNQFFRRIGAFFEFNTDAFDHAGHWAHGIDVTIVLG